MSQPVSQLQKTFFVLPVSKPRVTRRDSWPPFRPAVEKFHQYRDAIQRQLDGWELPAAGAHIIFYLPSPKSAKRKKNSIGGERTPHTCRPDIDNFLKAFLDSICKDSDDAYIYDIRASKYYAEIPRVEVWY